MFADIQETTEDLNKIQTASLFPARSATSIYTFYLSLITWPKK